MILLLTLFNLAQAQTVQIPGDKQADFYVCITDQYAKNVDSYRNRKGQVGMKDRQNLTKEARQRCLKELKIIKE